MEKLDRDVLSQVFVKFLSLKKKTKSHGNEENRRIYRIFLISRACFSAALESFRRLPILKIYDKRHFYMDLDFLGTLHNKFGSVPIDIQFFEYLYQKHNIFITQLSISIHNRHVIALHVLEKINFSGIKCTKCAIEGCANVYGTIFENILKTLTSNLKYLAIDNRIFKFCPKLNVKEVSIKAQDNVFDLEAARRINANTLTFANHNSRTDWSQLADFFGAFSIEEIDASIVHLRTPSNQLFQFHFPLPEKHINPVVKRFYLKLEGRLPGPRLDDIFSDLQSIFPCLEIFDISITSHNRLVIVPQGFESVHEFVEIYRRCHTSIDAIERDCKFMIPLEEFGKLVHNQLQDFKLIKNSEEDLSILQPYRSQGKPITVVTYQKDEKFYETNHKFKGKILIAFS